MEAHRTEIATTPNHPLVELALSQGIALDPDKLMRLMDLQERHERQVAARAFAEAIRQFQEKCPPIVKGHGVPNKQGGIKYLYADYDDVMRICQPILTELGIVVTFSSEPLNGMMKTTCRVRVGIHVEETTVTLPAAEIIHANSTQQMGGALSYGKRYSFVAALNVPVTGEDNDAQGAPELTDAQVKDLNELLDKCRAARMPEDVAQSFWDWVFVEENTSKRVAELHPRDFPRLRKAFQDWLDKYGGKK